MEAEVVHIRDIVAKPGTRASGFMTVGETPTEPVRVPLVVVHGHRPGPRLCLTAGVHAAEYPGIDAVMQTVQSLDPPELAGTVIAVPVVNPPMFQRRAVERMGRFRKCSPMCFSTRSSVRASTTSIVTAEIWARSSGPTRATR